MIVVLGPQNLVHRTLRELKHLPVAGNVRDEEEGVVDIGIGAGRPLRRNRKYGRTQPDRDSIFQAFSWMSCLMFPNEQGIVLAYLSAATSPARPC